MSDIVFRSDVTVKTMQTMGDDLTPLRAARVSTLGAGSIESGEADGLRRFLLREWHHVPFEHQAMTFYIEAPIFVTRQILKHRISSISESSGRYREMTGEFYLPAEDRKVRQVGKTGDYEFIPDVRAAAAARRGIRGASVEAWDDYQLMLQSGVAKEVARMVLPTNLYSQMWLTMNSRALMNFFSLRKSDWGSHPQHEIEMVADAMYKAWAEAFPLTAAAWRDMKGKGKDD